MGSTVRYALVGAGMMGAEHIRNLAITPGAELVAIVDPVDSSANSARAAAGQVDLRRFDSSAELAKAGVADAVIIASPRRASQSLRVATAPAPPPQRHVSNN